MRTEYVLDVRVVWKADAQPTNPTTRIKRNDRGILFIISLLWLSEVCRLVADAMPGVLLSLVGQDRQDYPFISRLLLDAGNRVF